VNTLVWFEHLAAWGRRAAAGDLEAVVAGERRVTLRMDDDIHIEPDLPGVTAVGMHRRAWKPSLVVSLHVDPDRAPQRASLHTVLGPGRAEPQSVDEWDRWTYVYPPPIEWGMPDGAELTVTVDGADRVRAIALEVPTAARAPGA